jgi:hypothetical protein
MNMLRFFVAVTALYEKFTAAYQYGYLAWLDQSRLPDVVSSESHEVNRAKISLRPQTGFFFYFSVLSPSRLSVVMNFLALICCELLSESCQEFHFFSFTDGCS